MSSWWKIRRKKSTATLPGIFSDSASLYATRPSQQGTLALPTKIDEVVRAVHDCIPSQLPGEEATQDDVRYFLYQILTLKESKFARNCPQWVLETCMRWQGDGCKLRSMPLDAFQQLCPLGPGYATIDYRGSKFQAQEIPPCDVRQAIGNRIRQVVAGLMKKETGHRGPGSGLHDSSDLRRPVAALPREMGRLQSPAPSLDHRFPMPSFAAAPGFPVQSPFYNFSNQSLPLFHQIPPVGVQQNPLYMQHRASFAGSQYGPPVADPVQRVLSPEGSVKLVPDDKPCDQGSPPLSSPASPTSSYCQTESISSRLSESTAKTSPPSSESENNFWAPKTDRPCSIAQPITDVQYTSPGMYQVSPSRTSTATPTRYKAGLSSTSAQVNGRSYDPIRRMAHLRSGSYSNTSTMYAPSEASLTPSDSVTNKYNFRRDSAMPPEMMHSLQRQSSFYPATASNPSRSSTPQTYVTPPPYPRSASVSTMQGPSPTRLGSATPMVRSQGNLTRPMNNYKVDAHAFEMAEHVGIKSMPGPMRSLRVETERNRVLTRGKSESGLNQRMNNYFNNVRGGEESVGPSIRFQNPRTGQPRLTIYETIEQKERLGKQHLESQRRVEMWQGRGLTMFQTIEEQEILNGRPQRGVDTSVQDSWTSYF
ncbi:hypothetical protein BU25DRAFT_476669 [Macroventuria anomochaeta]|uniref:Uncharacterized protein n=1 Tax=Macroventuria anomochaeta TaxID=301207 RepID=A0ACB6RU87_9PLEO|nr:uncharacterized protein BU25DRAFT_476669 [Macroventuria anomochaeta]KAF2624427.1 hypothetical protein BU25DRAFT_476669 [Macroventuria anomochaeta]